MWLMKSANYLQTLLSNLVNFCSCVSLYYGQYVKMELSARYDELKYRSPSMCKLLEVHKVFEGQARWSSYIISHL